MWREIMGEASTPEECLKGISKETGEGKGRRSLRKVQEQWNNIEHVMKKREKKLLDKKNQKVPGKVRKKLEQR